MGRGWNVLEYSEDKMIIRYIDGDVVVVKADGRTGYGFVSDYLRLMSEHYQGQLVVSDFILQMISGTKYPILKTFKRIYETHLAMVSVGCAFGPTTDKPHCDDSDNLSFTYHPCPIRAICPYNGYSNKGKTGHISGCNPLYEIGLTSRQIDITWMLVHTNKDLAEIANDIHVTEGSIRNAASEIYTSLGVRNRMELIMLLKDKRIK